MKKETAAEMEGLQREYEKVRELGDQACDYVYEIAYKAAKALQAGGARDQMNYVKAYNIAIQAYVEIDLITSEDAAKAVAEAYAEALLPKK